MGGPYLPPGLGLEGSIFWSDSSLATSHKTFPGRLSTLPTHTHTPTVFLLPAFFRIVNAASMRPAEESPGAEINSRGSEGGFGPGRTGVGGREVDVQASQD